MNCRGHHLLEERLESVARNMHRVGSKQHIILGGISLSSLLCRSASIFMTKLMVTMSNDGPWLFPIMVPLYSHPSTYTLLPNQILILSHQPY